MKIRGHTDNSGKEDFNRRLSNERAKAVASNLVSIGVVETAIVSEGLGSREPTADNSTDEGRRKNRRVEIFLTFHE